MTRGESGGREYVSDIVYYEYDRPRFVSGGTTSGAVDAEMTNRFTPTDTGTKIEFWMDVRFKGFMRLIQPLLMPGVKQQFRDNFEALREYIANNPIICGHIDPLLTTRQSQVPGGGMV